MQAIISFNFSDMKEELTLGNIKTETNVCSNFMNLLSIDINYIRTELLDKINFSDSNSIKQIYQKIYNIEPLLLIDEFDLINQFNELNNYSQSISKLDNVIIKLKNLLSEQKEYNLNSKYINELYSTLTCLKREKKTYFIALNNTQKYLNKIFKNIASLLNKYKKIIDICFVDDSINYFEGFSTLTPLKKFIFYKYFVLNDNNFFSNLPTSNIDFTFDCSIDDFEEKITNNINNSNVKNIFNELFKENISPRYEYNCQTLEQFLQVSLFTCLTFNLNIKKCKNCEKYFIAYQRSDEKYCGRISPQDNSKTCKQYSNLENWKNNINSNEELKMYRRIYMAKQMKVRRNTSDSRLKEDFEIWKKLSQEIKNQYSHGIIDKETFIIWLKNNS